MILLNMSQTIENTNQVFHIGENQTSITLNTIDYSYGINSNICNLKIDVNNSINMFATYNDIPLWIKVKYKPNEFYVKYYTILDGIKHTFGQTFKCEDNKIYKISFSKDELLSNQPCYYDKYIVFAEINGNTQKPISKHHFVEVYEVDTLKIEYDKTNNKFYLMKNDYQAIITEENETDIVLYGDSKITEKIDNNITITDNILKSILIQVKKHEILISHQYTRDCSSINNNFTNNTDNNNAVTNMNKIENINNKADQTKIGFKAGLKYNIDNLTHKAYALLNPNVAKPDDFLEECFMREKNGTRIRAETVQNHNRSVTTKQFFQDIFRNVMNFGFFKVMFFIGVLIMICLLVYFSA